MKYDPHNLCGVSEQQFYIYFFSTRHFPVPLTIDIVLVNRNTRACPRIKRNDSFFLPNTYM